MVVFYFSGTGNTKYVAENLAKQMRSDCYSIEEQQDFDALIRENNTVCFCYPIYCSGVPRIMREFAEGLKMALKGKRVAIFCTQVMYSGDGARAFTDIFPENWFKVVYAEHFFMPNNLCNVLPEWTFDDRLIRWEKFCADRKIKRISRHIMGGKVHKRGFNKISYKMGYAQRKYQLGADEKAKNGVEVSDDCVKCGLCVKKCPMQNFELGEEKAVPKGNCIYCYRCVNLCPKKAITVVYRKEINKQYKGIEGVK